MFHHLDPALEPAVAKAVDLLRHASLSKTTHDVDTIEATADEVRSLCEVTANLLSQMLVSSGDWPEERYIDGLIPISIDTAKPDSVELAGGAIVAEGDDWFVEPVLARFVVAGETVCEFALLFGHSQREPLAFDPDCETFELEFPSEDDTEAWRFSFSAQEEPLG
jgi:hypothetical protein